MTIDYSTLADEKLRTATLSGECTFYIFFEARPSFEEPGQAEDMMRRVFSALDLSYCCNTPGMPLPNGNFLFYCYVDLSTLSKLLATEGIKEGYRGDSFELLFEKYEFFKYVFKGVGERMGFSGKMEPFYGSLSEFVPGDRLNEIYPTGVFSGGPSFELKPSAETRKKMLPEVNNFTIEGIEPEKYYYFLIGDFGVYLEDMPYLDLGFGIQWWPSVNFPASDIVLNNLVAEYSDLARQTFTGVLLVPKNSDIKEHREKMFAVQEMRRNIRRLRTFFDIKHNSNMKILGEVELGVSDDGRYFKQTATIGEQFYTTWSKNYRIPHSVFNKNFLVESVELSFMKPTRKEKFISSLQRSIDSLDLARTIGGDSLVSHVLVWASIEAIISPEDDRELISNMTLSLLGLQDSVVEKSEFWSKCKESYAIRSKIVHSFEIPEQEKLFDNIMFAERECERLLKKVILEVIPSRISKDDFIKRLRALALQ